MKYVLLGNLSPEWASKQSDRIGKAKKKLDQLGIKIKSIHYSCLRGGQGLVDVTLTSIQHQLRFRGRSSQKALSRAS